MPHRLLLTLWIAFLVGCGKSTTPPSPTDSPRVPSSESKNESADTSVPLPTPAGRINDEQQIASTLNELTQAVRKFGVEQQRIPGSLNDLVTAGYLTSVPDPPAGKKFTISKKLEVYLTKQ